MLFCVIGQNKHSCDWLAALATKGGLHFQRPQGGCKGFIQTGAFYNLKAPTSPAQRYYITPEGGALNPSGRRQPVPDRTLGAQGQRPGGAINPHARKGVSTFGNTGKHRPGPDPDRTAPKRRKRQSPMSPAFFSTPKEHAGLLITIPFPQ